MKKSDFIKVIRKSAVYASFVGSLALNYVFIVSAYSENCNREHIHLHGCGSHWLDKIIEDGVIEFVLSTFTIVFIPAFIIFFIWYYSEEKILIKTNRK